MKNLPLVISEFSQYGGNKATIGIVIAVVIVIIIVAVVVIVASGSSTTPTPPPAGSPTPPATGSPTPPPAGSPTPPATGSPTPPPAGSPTPPATGSPTPPPAGSPTPPVIAYSDGTQSFTADSSSTYTICGTGGSTIGDGQSDNLCLQVYGGSYDNNPLKFHGGKDYNAQSPNGHFNLGLMTGGTYDGNFLITPTDAPMVLPYGQLTLQAVGGSVAGNEIKLHDGMVINVGNGNGNFAVTKAGSVNGSDFYTICTTDTDLCWQSDGTLSSGGDTTVVLTDNKSTSSKKNTATFFIDAV
jgi:hypothetical protein